MQDTKRGFPFWGAALLASVLAAGGFGPHEPVVNAALEAAAFLTLTMIVTDVRAWRTPAPGARAAVGLIGIFLAIGLAQLVPLPASFWTMLPGREIPGRILADIGRGAAPFPISLSPDDTRLALLAWLPPIAIFLVTLRLSTRDRIVLAWIVVGVALASIAVALTQLSFGDGTLLVYPVAPYDRYPGIFANANHQATFLAATLTLLGPLALARGRGVFGYRPALLVIAAVLLLGALLTASRTGVLLFLAAAAWSGYRAYAVSQGFASRRGAAPRSAAPALRAAVVVVAVAAALSVAWLLAQSYRGELIAARFGGTEQDARLRFWPVVLVAIHSYFPVGAGLGTFLPVYKISEQLADVDRLVVNHAHNDYLELILETGVAGAVWLALAIAWFVARIVRVARVPHRAIDGALARSGAAVIVLVMLHSLVDYPLRTEAIGCLVGYAAALLIPAAGETVLDRETA